MTNFDNFQTLMPQYFPSVRVLSTRNNVSIVEEHMILGSKELIMMTKHIVQDQDRHEMFIIGGDAKGTHIVETFEQTSEGSKLIVSVDFKFKGTMKIFSLWGKEKIKNDYTKIVDEFVKIAGA